MKTFWIGCDKVFEEGAKLADKTMIEKTCTWLKK